MKFRILLARPTIVGSTLRTYLTAEGDDVCDAITELQRYGLTLDAVKDIERETLALVDVTGDAAPGATGPGPRLANHLFKGRVRPL